MHNKAFRVTSDHIKLAGPQVVSLLTDLTNWVFKEEQFSDDLKFGIATPMPKKDHTQTDKFRWITISTWQGIMEARGNLCDPPLKEAES